MNFTFPALSRSLADCPAPDLPGVRFFADPAQQGAKPPMLFLRQTHASISPQTGGRLLRKLGLDLVYLEQFNRLGADSRLQEAADVLDLRLEVFPYRSATGEEPVLLRTYDRSWEITDSALHYKFQLRLRLTAAEDAALMRSIQELNMEVDP